MNIYQEIATLILGVVLIAITIKWTNTYKKKGTKILLIESHSVNKASVEEEQLLLLEIDEKLQDFVIPDGKICTAIEDLIGHSSIVEFGAQTGQNGRCWLRSFDNLLNTDMDIYKIYYKNFINEMENYKLIDKPQIIYSWEGYEFKPNIERVTQGWVKYFDPNQNFNVGKTFDWVVSFGVDKNVPCGMEHEFIHNLIKHAKEGIILSLDYKDKTQLKKQHPNDCIIKPSLLVSKLEEENWRRDEESELLVIERIKEPFLNQRLMIFRKIDG